MTSNNGGRGSAADVIIEPPPNAPAASTAGARDTSPITRTELRAKQKFQQNRFVIIGAGALVVALLLFVAVSMPRKSTSPTPKTGVVGGQAKSQQGESPTDGRSLLPITDSGRPTGQNGTIRVPEWPTSRATVPTHVRTLPALREVGRQMDRRLATPFVRNQDAAACFKPTP